jgi:hypothetical protein
LNGLTDRLLVYDELSTIAKIKKFDKTPKTTLSRDKEELPFGIV